MSPRICCVGDLVTDVVVHLDREPRRGTDTPAQISHTRGGSAANVSVAVTAAGGVGRFVGNVGDDAAGDALVDDLRDNHVEPYVLRSGTTGSVVVLVDETGERSFLTDRGAATQLASVPAGALDDVDLLHIPAYSFLDGPLAETSEQILGAAVDLGIPISLSTGSVTAIAQYGRDAFLELIAAIGPEYVFANQPEFALLSTGDAAFAGAKVTIVTNGAEAAVVKRTERPEIRVATQAVEAVDTTGAGDAFAAGFLVSRQRGETLEVSVRNGHALAANTLRSTGAVLARD